MLHRTGFSQFISSDNYPYKLIDILLLLMQVECLSSDINLNSAYFLHRTLSLRKANDPIPQLLHSLYRHSIIAARPHPPNTPMPLEPEQAPLLRSFQKRLLRRHRRRITPLNSETYIHAAPNVPFRDELIGLRKPCQRLVQYRAFPVRDLALSRKRRHGWKDGEERGEDEAGNVDAEDGHRVV